MTDHARPPEGVETWTVWVCPTHGVVMPGSPWSVEHDDELIHTPTVPCNRICPEVEVVRLSALLAEREARERAEGERDEAEEQEQATWRLEAERRCAACGGTGRRGYPADAPGSDMYEDCSRCDGTGDEAYMRIGELEDDRDAAVARAEQAERDVEKLIADYRAALDDAKREYDRAEQAEAERDEARKMLGECYLLSGADPDGNDWPHLWRDAVQAVKELRADCRECLRRYVLGRDER